VARKPSGRPPGRPTPDEPLDQTLHVRLSTAQRTWIEAYAAERGLASASDGLRHVLARVIAGTPPPGPPAPRPVAPRRVYGSLNPPTSVDP